MCVVYPFISFKSELISMFGLFATPTNPEDDGQSEAEYIQLSQPKAVGGKLYNQDYWEITDKLLKTGKLFEDPMVK